MGRMPGGDLLLLALIALGSIWWLGVQYGAAVTQRAVIVRETVREVVREVQREAPRSPPTGVMAMTPSSFQYIYPAITRSFIGTISSSVFYGIPYRSPSPCRGITSATIYEAAPVRGLNQEMPCPP